jgi:hypothetical protein
MPLASIALATWQQVRYDRPPAGTLRRGMLWISSPRVLVATVLVVVAAVVAIALYQRLRRR